MGKKKIKQGKNEKLRMQKKSKEEYFDTLRDYLRKVMIAIFTVIAFNALCGVVDGITSSVETRIIGSIAADNTLRVVGTASEYQMKACNRLVIAMTVVMAAKTILCVFNVINIKVGLAALTDAILYIGSHKGEERKQLSKLEAVYSKFIRLLISDAAIVTLWASAVVSCLADLVNHIAKDAIEICNIIGLTVETSVGTIEKVANVVEKITSPVQVVYAALMLCLVIISIFKELMGVDDFLGTRL